MQIQVEEWERILRADSCHQAGHNEKDEDGREDDRKDSQ